ncbi:MAG: hypothetical protein EHM47_04050 [Ignavibacteriales bacterium]|nr:MAG: hypothetical protein EHM47_04050 [Ignavibacteriales bacterium]
MKTIRKLFQRYKNNFRTRTLLFFSTILILFIQGIILTNNIEDWLDIRLWDETLYLGNGIYFFKQKIMSDWGPVYSLWYFILNLFTNDPINLYYLNYRLMIVLLPVIMSVFIYRLTNNVIISFFYSYLLLISMMNLFAWPRISHFLLIVILITFIAVTFIKSKEKKLVVAGLTTLIILYIRPEYVIAFFVFLFIIGFLAIKKKIKINNLFIVTAGTTLLIIILGVPFSSSRSLTAFGQGYEKYIPQNERLDESGKVKEWTEILYDDFGDPGSIFEAMKNNPGEFFFLLWQNIKSLPGLPSIYKEFIFPSQFIHISGPLISRILVSLIALIPLLIIFLNKNDNKNYNQSLSNIKFIIGLSFILCIPPLSGIILFFPRLHYLILLLPLFYSLLVIIFIPFTIKNYATEVSALILVLILSFIFLPDFSSWFGKQDAQNRNTIISLRNLNSDVKINILENNGGFAYYLGENYTWIKIHSKEEPFGEFLINQKINLIVDTETLSQSSQLKNDSTWYKFLTDPRSFGFKENVLSSGVNIFLKENGDLD